MTRESVLGLEAVLADAPVRQETELLKRLAALWSITVRVIDAPE